MHCGQGYLNLIKMARCCELFAVCISQLSHVLDSVIHIRIPLISLLA